MLEKYTNCDTCDVELMDTKEQHDGFCASCLEHEIMAQSDMHNDSPAFE